MATYEEKIEAMTQINIGDSSAPTSTELNEFLSEGLICTANRIIQLRPEELFKFCETTNSTSSITRKGKVLSVVREHDSTSILRVCTPINPGLRYEATDIESLLYRSKYNPAFYELDGNIHCIPEASASNNNDIVVTQVNYDTDITGSQGYNQGLVSFFPLEYEYLIVLYTAATTCQSAALDLQNNLPEKPIPPSIPDFSHIENAELPSLPTYHPLSLSMPSISKAKSNINSEDFEKAEKWLSVVEKEVEQFTKSIEVENSLFERDMDVFKASLENEGKNTDRNAETAFSEYRSKIYKYQYDIQGYSQELQEILTRYKWFIEQYTFFFNEYNQGIMLMNKKIRPPEGQSPKKPREEPMREEEPMEGAR